jgi:hypothetical protein
VGGIYKERPQARKHQSLLKPGEQILYTCRCQCITPFSTREGELLLASVKAYYFDMSEPASSLSGPQRQSMTVGPSSTSGASGGGEQTERDKDGRRKKGQWMGNKSIAWLYEEVREVHRRRYLLKNTALEIFLTNGRTHLFSFSDHQEREEVYQKVLPNFL